jgi:hypothetical protein
MKHAPRGISFSLSRRVKLAQALGAMMHSLAVAAQYAGFQSRDREGVVSPEYVAVFMKRCTNSPSRASEIG